jgi:hypothetical protein
MPLIQIGEEPHAGEFPHEAIADNLPIERACQRLRDVVQGPAL